MVELPIKLKTDFNEGLCTCDVLDLIRKWFREEKHTYIGAYISIEDEQVIYRYQILDFTNKKSLKKPFLSSDSYSNYEDAIREAIKYITEPSDTYGLN